MTVYTMIAEHPVVPGVLVRTFTTPELRAAAVESLKAETDEADRAGLIFELFESTLES